MVDLSLQESHAFWDGFPDKSVYHVIVLLESVEKSFLDGDKDFEDKMQALGDALDGLAGRELDNKQLVLDVAANLRTSRYLRLLQSLDMASPGAASKVIAFAEKSDPGNAQAQLFLRRNIIFERYRLLGQVFSQDRFDILLKALEI